MKIKTQIMKNLKQDINVLDSEFDTLQGHRNGNICLVNLIDEKSSIPNLMLQLTALLLTLPIITALLLVWFKFN